MFGTRFFYTGNHTVDEARNIPREGSALAVFSLCTNVCHFGKKKGQLFFFSFHYYPNIYHTCVYTLAVYDERSERRNEKKKKKKGTSYSSVCTATWTMIAARETNTNESVVIFV